MSVNKIEQALKSPVECNFVDVSLKDALDGLSELTQIPIVIDQKTLTENGISTDSTVTLTLHGPTLHSALGLLLEPMTLDYVIGNGVLKVTSIEAADATLQTRQYDVAELIDFSNEQQRDSDYRLLSRAIQMATRSQWEDRDSNGGTITLDIEAQSVSVKQSQRVHRAIGGLLTSLKKAKQTAASSAR